MVFCLRSILFKMDGIPSTHEGIPLFGGGPQWKYFLMRGQLVSEVINPVWGSVWNRGRQLWATVLCLYLFCIYLIYCSDLCIHPSPGLSMKTPKKANYSHNDYHHTCQLVGLKILEILLFWTLRSHSSEPLPPTARILSHLSSVQQDLTGEPQ